MSRTWMRSGARVPFLTVALGQLLVVAALIPAGHAQERSGSLAGVAKWGYQLQVPKVERIHSSPHDLVVVDYSKDGSDEGAFKPAELERMQNRPGGGRRLVLCYLSIGEAETYRGYWQWYWGGKWYSNWLGWFLAPSWVGPENKDWGGNFAVRYWQPGWQKLILGADGAIERIIAAGFDGVYLDKIDSSIEAIARKRPTARDDMRAFVRLIAEKGRSARPGFLVVPQNGEELLEDDAYVRVIDGIGKEDLLFGEFKEKQANPETVVLRRTELLKRAGAAGKTVLAVEYLDDAEAIAQSRTRLEGLGFVPYFGDRELRTLRYGDLPETAKTQ